jgi:hypothetical protein
MVTNVETRVRFKQKNVQIPLVTLFYLLKSLRVCLDGLGITEYLLFSE